MLTWLASIPTTTCSLPSISETALRTIQDGFSNVEQADSCRELPA